MFPLLGSRRVARTSFLTVERVYHLAPAGGWTRRDVVRHPGSVVVVPWDGARFHFILQFRVPVGRPVLEFPAGKLDVAGEPPTEAARRELAEEIGLAAGRLTLLHTVLPSPGFTDEVGHVYLAEDLSPVAADPQGSEEAAAETLALDAAEVARRLRGGEIEDATTLVGAYAALARLNP